MEQQTDLRRRCRANGRALAALLASVAFCGPALSQTRSTPSHCVGVLQDGQSNDQGQGALPPGVSVITASNDRQHVFTKGAQWWTAFEPMQSQASTYGGIAFPVYADQPIGVGPGLAFSEELSALMPSTNVCTIVGAKGGVALAQQMPSTDTATLYGANLALIAAAQATATVPIKVVTFVGMESDATRADWANAVASNFAAWVADVRARHGANVVVVFARLGDDPGSSAYPFWSVVRDQQAAVAIPGVFMVETDGLEKQTDRVHYTTAALTTLGRSMARAARVGLGRLPGEAF